MNAHASFVRDRPSASCAAASFAGGRVVSRRKLFYAEGDDPRRDRPAHVRAGSGCCFIDLPGHGTRLAVIQDAAAFLALVNPDDGSVHSIDLPPGPGGLRQFDAARGNKMEKRDLESIAAFSMDGTPALLAMGSGSHRRREVFVVIQFSPHGPVVRELEAPAFFAALKNHKDFAGDELNVEGMLIDDDRVCFFNRGNGAGVAVNAVCETSLWQLMRHVHDPETYAVPTLSMIRTLELGRDSAGTRFSLTDAARHSQGATFFLAAAEASPNAIDDGQVTATALGVLRDDGTWSMDLLVDASGAVLRDKVEGLAVDPHDPQRLWLVVDQDEPATPSELLEVELR